MEIYLRVLRILNVIIVFLFLGQGCVGNTLFVINDGGVEVDDGGVIIKDGGESFDGGDIIDGDVLSDGGAVIDGGQRIDGGLWAEDGGDIKIEDGGKTSDGGPFFVDGGFAEDGGIVFEDGGTFSDGGVISDGEIMVDDGGALPDSGMTTEDAGQVMNGGLTADGGPVVGEEGEKCSPNRACRSGLFCYLNVCVLFPVVDGGFIFKDGGLTADGGTMSDGGQISDGGEIILTNDGGQVSEDGGVAIIDGGPIADGGVLSDGGAIAEDGGEPFFNGGIELGDGGDKVWAQLCKVDDLDMGRSCSQTLISRFQTAKKSIHILIYDFNLRNVADILTQIASPDGGVGDGGEVDIKVIFDQEHVLRNGKIIDGGIYDLFRKQGIISIAYGGTSNKSMHNKVAIIDRKTVMTGSYNWTTGAENLNDENLLVVSSVAVANIYENRFDALWRRYALDGGQRDGEITDYIISDRVEVCFSPLGHCGSRIAALIANAQSPVHVAANWFTNCDIGKAALHFNGEARIIIDKLSAYGTGSIYEYLKRGIGADRVIVNMRSSGGGMMHHKFMVINNATVATGSMNYTGAGSETNDENVIIINSIELANKYEAEFNRIFSQGDANYYKDGGGVYCQ